MARWNRIKCDTCGGAISLEDLVNPHRTSISVCIECSDGGGGVGWKIYYDFCNRSCLERCAKPIKDVIKTL